MGFLQLEVRNPIASSPGLLSYAFVARSIHYSGTGVVNILAQKWEADLVGFRPGMDAL